jgi:hypothetical protein
MRQLVNGEKTMLLWRLMRYIGAISREYYVFSKRLRYEIVADINDRGQREITEAMRVIMLMRKYQICGNSAKSYIQRETLVERIDLKYSAAKSCVMAKCEM